MIGNYVPLWGKVPNDLLIVGEGPGRQESVEGVPFCGASGSELDWVFLKRAAKLCRDDFAITNIVKWRTDEKDSDPSVEDIVRDEPELIKEIAAVNPSIIVAVGRIATGWFLQSDHVDMEKLHGTPIPCPRFPDKTLIAVYHPAAGLHQPERYYHQIFWDFIQVGKLVRGEISQVTDQYLYPLYILDNAVPFTAEDIAVDTEGSKDKFWGMSFSQLEGTGWVNRTNQDTAWAKRFIYHNALYDMNVLGSYSQTFEDTMLMAYLLPWLPRGLKPLAFKLCGMEMQSYEEVTGQAQEEIAKEYLLKVVNQVCSTCNGLTTVNIPYKRQPSKLKAIKCPTCLGDGTKWPTPQGQLIFDNNGVGRVYKPRSTGRSVRTLLERGTDLKAGWESLPVQVRDTPESEFGKLREVNLDDIPLEDAVHYSAKDADATLRVFHILEPILKKEGLWNIYEIDKGIVPIIGRMQENGILIDKEYFEYLDADFEAQQIEAQNKLSQLAGTVINPSSPLQVAALLYDKFGCKPYRGNRTTDEKTLESIKIKYEDELLISCIDLITDYRELAKLRGTYVQVLPKCADANSRVHTRFLLHVTTSGRLSSREPNLQNVPKRTERGRLIRQGFIAREGCVLVSVDLDQIELRVAAHLSEDQNMIDVFLNNKDIHKATASLIYQKPEEEVTAQERLLSKTINFGILYGMSARRLERELNLLGIEVTYDQCIQYINQWFAAYPGIRDYIDRCHQQAKDNGYVECLFGRRRYLPGVHSTIDKVREESLRWSVNHPDQGTAAAILKQWMYRVWSFCIPTVQTQGYCEPILTVHDELIFECEKHLVELLIALVVSEAQQTMTMLVPIKAKGSSALNWNGLS